MLNKKILIIIVITVVFLLIIGARVWIRSARIVPPQTVPQTGISLSKTPIPTPDNRVYRVVKVVPAHGTENVSPDTNITVSFDQNPDPDFFEVFISPKVDFLTTYSGATITLNPVKDLERGTAYNIAITYKNGEVPFAFSFVTAGAFKGIKDTEPPGSAENTAKLQLEKEPDLYLRNLTPYTSSSFDIISDYVGGEDGHFQFRVIQKSDNYIQDFYDYLSSLGLTDGQIETLDIIYEQNSP